MLSMLDIDDALEYEKEFESYEIVDDRVQVKFTDGSAVRGQLLVGADGIKSRVRRQLQPDRRLLDLERWVLWGRTPLTEHLKANISPDLLSWCMYLDQDANVQAVVEPMTWSKSVRQESQGRLPDFSDYVYWVICTAPFQFSRLLPKTTEQKRLFLKGAAETWHPDLKLLLDSAAHDLSACVPVLSSKPNIELCTAGQTARVTLIGDAAHSMSPMGGSGADTAVRNAADLALTIAEEGITTSSITDFGERAEARAKEKIEHSFNGGKKFWRGKEWTEYGEIDVRKSSEIYGRRE
jgi:2-polyprenyl-6-methoxyphenol hydroxylase-like FAD-dependent oxidoreductase